MTSQVAIYNMNGMAIASDTVVTSTSPAGSKTTANAEKIYEIGPDHKVLVMHYGGTTLNDLHHQFHFAEWALTQREPLATLADYVEAYVKWTSYGRRFHSDKSEGFMMLSVIEDHFNELKARIDSAYSAFERSPQMTDEEVSNFVISLNKQHIAAGLDHLKSCETFAGASEVSAKEALKAAGIDLGKLVDEAFDGYIVNPALKTLLKNSAVQSLIRKQSMPWDSYLAFVGYGKDDPFPGVIVLSCRGFYMGQLMHDRGEKTVIQPGLYNSEISRFAQSEAIEAFLQGYNTDIMNGVTWSIENQLQTLMGDEFNPQLSEKVRANVLEYIETHSWRRYVQPILRQVAGMNLFGLAELARTLVSIQATFSESQDGPVSVGGLIEVVTIDRVNGVQWKQRLPR